METEQHPSKEDGEADLTDRLTVIGIGASAGGLEALRTFFEALPADTGMSFVVIVHLDPEHESHLDELLQAKTRMPVTQVNERVAIERNHIYVIPPSKRLEATDSALAVHDFDEPRGQRAPIDLFFRSLAAVHGDGGAIILSGGGTDGSVGIKSIKEAGGLVLVQDPREAQYDSMPRNAIATGMVDVVLPVKELAEQLVELKQRSVAFPQDPDALTEREVKTLQHVLAQLRARTGHDFARYKRSTVMRRLQRRMQVSGKTHFDDYLVYLRENAGEAQALFKELLIGVTNFFRDPDAFEALREQVLPKLFEGKEAGDTVRIWTVGCSTGEEAYSLTMLLHEHAHMLDIRPDIQVFASDLDESALTTAREGLYPRSIEADVSEERLKRFFVREGDHYHIASDIREKVLFATHSVLKDPPFSRLDLIVCRNLLIYLQRDLQNQVFEIFHYALRPTGYLFLGGSETAEGSAGLFRAIDKKHRLYQAKARTGTMPRLPMLTSELAYTKPVDVPQEAAGKEGASEQDLHRHMLEAYAPPSVLVDESYHVVHLSEQAGRFLQHPAGTITNDLVKLVRPELQTELRSALFQAFERETPTVAHPVLVQFNGHPHTVYLTVRLRPRQADEERLALVILNEDETPQAPRVLREGMEGDASALRRSEEELRYTRERLQATVEEFESSREELKAQNEELRSINEEYKSAMEELETSKEELQSVNEELETVNYELKNKLDEISRAHSDLHNLIEATDVGTLFLDRQLRIKRYTPTAEAYLNIMPSDRGRPFSHITHRFAYDRLEADAEQVLADLTPIEQEIRDEAGRCYLLRLRPYRTVEDKIDGVVLTFVDVTRIKEAKADLRRSEERYELLVESVTEYAIFMTDTEGRVTTWNQGAQRIFGYSEEEAVGTYAAMLIHTQAAQRAGRAEEKMKLARQKGHTVDDHWYVRQGGARFWGTGVMTALYDESNTLQGFAKVLRDNTRQREAEERLSRSEERYRTLFESIDEGFCVLEVLFDAEEHPVDYRFLEINPAFEQQTGLVDAVGKTALELIPDLEGHWVETYGRVAMTGKSTRFVEESAAMGRWFEVAAFRIGKPEDRRVALLFTDITVRMKREEDLRNSEQRLRTLNETLEERVEQRTLQVRELASTLTMAEQSERRRISQILHDDLQQILYGIQLKMSFIRQHAASGTPGNLAAYLDEADDWMNKAIATTRQLTVDLSPPVLKSEGLTDTIIWLVTQMKELHGLTVNVQAKHAFVIPDEDMRVLLFQTIRELLFNIVKHASTDYATVEITDADDHLIIRVVDEGDGFDSDEASRQATHEKGFGLYNVRERLALFGGRMEIDSAPGDGTRITIYMPITPTKSQEVG